VVASGGETIAYVWFTHGLPDHVGGRIKTELEGRGSTVEVIRDRTWCEISPWIRTLCTTDYDMVSERTIAPPDFIKCDVEGAELLVFRSARAVLDRPDAPTMLFEVNAHTAAGFGFGTSGAKKFLAALPVAHYHLFEVKDDGALPAITTLTPWCNLRAIPEAKLPRFAELAAGRP